ncbi:hypothetical protein FSARC_13212 [Fusarium sarcochroum]|uniref:Major facilitator superfamily (MFS) profile domain-containing protein n=1 Tax=Fusarium sarcochroum TaxID=1208366 RepID=A0A8H4T372_9HYPO|nr:hypothetical protein FSARC_13212 [Fusarium sarcochroum]
MRESVSGSASAVAENGTNTLGDERTPLLKSTSQSQNQDSEPASEVRGEEPNQGVPAGQEEETTIVAEEVSTGKLVLIFGTSWIGVFLGAVDSTIIATLSGPISSEFQSLSLLSWLATAYLISNAACQPISGRLTDIFGRGPGLVFSNIFFAAGNLICGLAKDETSMIIGRVVAGIGGGGLMSISTFLGSDLVPLRKRGIIQGLGNICYGSGAMLGGVFGGLINDHTSQGWRLAFLIQVPPVLVSAVAVHFLVRVPPKQSDKSFLSRIDFVGAFLTSSFLVFLLLGLNSGGNTVPWTHPLPLTSIPLAVITFGLFLYWESKASQPIIPVKLLLDRTVLNACLCNLFCTMVVMGALFYVPLYLQVLGSSATQSGVQILPSPIGISVGSLISGFMMKKTGKYTKLGVTGLLVLIAGVVFLTAQNEHSPKWLMAISFFLIGSGYGATLTTTLLACIAAVDHSQQAVITSATYLARSLGSTVGITIGSAVYQNILKARLWERFGDQPGAADEIRRIRDNLDEINHLPEGCKEESADEVTASSKSNSPQPDPRNDDIPNAPAADSPKGDQDFPYRILKLTPIEKNARRDYIRISMALSCPQVSYLEIQRSLLYSEVSKAFVATIYHWPFLAGLFKVLTTDTEDELVLLYPKISRPDNISRVFTMDPTAPRPGDKLDPDLIYTLPMEYFAKRNSALPNHNPTQDGPLSPVALRLRVVGGLLTLSFAFSELIFDAQFIHNFFREFLNNTDGVLAKGQVINRGMPERIDSGLEAKYEFPCFDWNRTTEVEEPTPREELEFKIFRLKGIPLHRVRNKIQRLVREEKMINYPLIEDCIFALFWALIILARVSSKKLAANASTNVNIMIPGHLSTTRREYGPDYFGNSTVAAVASCDVEDLVGPEEEWDDEGELFMGCDRLAFAASIISGARREVNKDYMRKLYGLKQAISPAEDRLAYERALRRHTGSLIFEDWTCYGAQFECHLSFVNGREPRFVPCIDDLLEGTVILLPRKNERDGLEDWHICVCLHKWDMEVVGDLLKIAKLLPWDEELD